MKSGPPPKKTNAGARPHIVANDADARIRFTIFKNAVGRLSKKFWLTPDGSIDTDPATQLWQGSFEVVIVDASDLHRALSEIGSKFETLSSDEAIGCGVPLSGDLTGTITVVDRHKAGLDAGAIPRSLSHFGAPPQGDYGLVLFDGDGIAGLSAILTELYPPFADAAVLVRPSASASVKDPKTGAALKVGEHLYAVLDEPALAAECLKAVLRLAWCSGQGWVMLTTSGAMLARGPIDASVGSLERLSYEGEAMLGKGIERLPRVSTVAGGMSLERIVTC